jgi:hypothetical protein
MPCARMPRRSTCYRTRNAKSECAGSVEVVPGLVWQQQKRRPSKLIYDWNPAPGRPTGSRSEGESNIGLGGGHL